MIRTTSSPASAPASRVACRWLSLKNAGTVTTAFATARPSSRSALAGPPPRAAGRCPPAVFRRPFDVLAPGPDRRGGGFRGPPAVELVGEYDARRAARGQFFAVIELPAVLGDEPGQRGFAA